MKDKKRPATKKDVEAFFENLSELEVRQFLERVLKGKKPKKLDLLCWQCKHAGAKTCPKSTSGMAPKAGTRKCSNWITSPTVEYGDSPRKRSASKALLAE